MRHHLSILPMLTILLLVCSSGLPAHPGPFDGRDFQGRIAFSSDGNCNDEDDWGAFPVAVALLDAFGVTGKLVHVDYCNILGKNDPRFYREMVASVLGAAERYGVPRSILFDCQKDPNGALESIRRAIDASSADDPLYYVLAGPMEVPLLGIRKSDPAKRKHVYCISHSVWNDGFPQPEKEHLHRYNKRDIIESGVHWVQVKPGSGLTNSTRTSSTPAQWALYHWMKDSKDARLGWIYTRLEVQERCDVSDATMTYFLLTADVEIRYLDEDGGQSQLALHIDGLWQGESWMASADNDAWQSKTVANVTIDAGDEITIEARGDGREAARLDYVQLHYRAQVSGNGRLGRHSIAILRKLP